VVNAFLLILVAFVVPGFAIDGWPSALVGAVVLAAVNLLWKRATAEKKSNQE
jgi:uncharacterized membrane protein YvlD (DUF360 family)